MSLSAMESRSAQSRWFAENSNQDMLEKMKKGFGRFSDAIVANGFGKSRLPLQVTAFKCWSPGLG